MAELDFQIAGALAAGVAAGIKQSGALDLALISVPEGAHWAAVTTRHQLRAAPVRLLEALRRGEPRRPLHGVIVNAGNANALTGDAGMQAAKAMARAASIALGCEADEVAVCSTGVIGVPLPEHMVRAAVPELKAALRPDGWREAATAIRTTDAYVKMAYRQVHVDDGAPAGHVGIVAKGAGMIAPNMATMLVFIATDVRADDAMLDELLQEAVEQSFHRITVDGDRSTNDVVLLLSTGAADADAADPAVRAALSAALTTACIDVAQQIVRDGEGARRVGEITVEGALSDADAGTVAKAIGNSPLVKTALYGADPNWGRIAAAAGGTDVVTMEEQLVVTIGDAVLFERGQGPDAAAMRRAEAVMQADWVPIHVRIGKGPGRATVWASDLGHEYVTCNADYRT